MIQTFDFDLSDFLCAEIAIVDQAGAIVHRNSRWNEAAAAGLLASKRSGWNYIEECEAAFQRGCNDAADVLIGLRRVLQGDVPSFVAVYTCPFNGMYRWFQVSISALQFNGTRHAIVMHVDVSAMQRDGLTGLPNRAMFDAQADLALSMARAAGERTGIILFDMDNLKAINDKHGHHTGDQALRALAAEIKAKAGPDCVVARIGGDEFGAVLPVSQDTLSARRVRSHFGSGIVCSIGSAPQRIYIAASVGIALYPADGATVTELFKAADKSMYAHKRGTSVA